MTRAEFESRLYELKEMYKQVKSDIVVAEESIKEAKENHDAKIKMWADLSAKKVNIHDMLHAHVFRTEVEG